MAPLLIGVMLLLVFSLRRCLIRQTEILPRPWAYASTPGEPLLVGSWAGEFRDPSGITKQITLTIDPPLSEEELRKREIRPHSGRVRAGDFHSFDGKATVNGPFGVEHYDVFGAVNKEDMRQVTFDFAATDEANRPLPNQAARSAQNGRWDKNELRFELTFTPLDEHGVSRSSDTGIVVNGELVWEATDAEKPVSVTLTRADATAP